LFSVHRPSTAQDELLTGRALPLRRRSTGHPYNSVLRQAQGRLLAGQGAPELLSSGSSPSAPAAINGSSHRHLYRAICVPGNSIGTDRITVIAAIENLRPAVRATESGRALTVRCLP
jgi:hypothetical protein